MDDRGIGKILDGKYEILEQLQGGGMGEIYLVRHLHLQQKRVVKILRRELAADTAAQARFLREARLATHVKHPNVAILYDFAKLPDESFYMVWEYIEGEDIHRLIQSRGPFPMGLALQVAIQALRGLESIHAAGVIHRDVSPDNLMITQDNRGRSQVKIIDLGLAKGQAVEPNLEVSQAGMFMGKLRYCSPEQAEMPEGERLDARTDLYSFGLVLYEMLTGKPPFDSDSTAGFIFRRLTEDPLPLRGRTPGVEISPALNGVVLRALRRDRTERYTNAIEFIEALEPLERGLNQATTQRISVVPRESSVNPDPTASPAATIATSGKVPEKDAASTRSSSRISQSERVELLAQIDRAARRMRQTSQLFEQAEEALAIGDIDKAQEIEQKLQQTNPRAAGLSKLSERLRLEGGLPSPATEEEPPLQSVPEQPRAEVSSPLVEAVVEPDDEGDGDLAEASPDQIAESERILQDYLRQGKTNLAALALSTLLELQPNHPKKQEYESWVRIANQEEGQLKRAQKAVEVGRQALERQDFKAARKQLDLARRNDHQGRVSDAFAEEVEEAERDGHASTEITTLRGEFDTALAEGQIAQAEELLEKMAGFGTSRVALTFYRQRVEAEKERLREQATFEEYNERVQDKLARGDFEAARETAHEVSSTLPKSTVAASLVEAIDRQEQKHRRLEAIEQGVQQVEDYLAAGNPDAARLGLKILKQMDPEDARWPKLEKRLQE
ncbi:MAG: protein kinase [Deltaproteobacteria bacterium]|nr:protein kinase [Deltaproteobacteria bacterium]